MSTYLYIKASPRHERSRSGRVAEAFLKAWVDAQPGREVQTLDLFEEDLPEFDDLASQGKYAIMRGVEAADEVKAAWANVVAVIEEFKACDGYVFAVPMWNFGIPYRLKHYLDLIIQPTLTFSSGAGGYQGLVQGKPAFCFYARGGEYPEESPVDFQQRYLDHALRFIGFTDIHTVLIQPTVAGGPAAADVATEAAIVKARALAAGQG